MVSSVTSQQDSPWFDFVTEYLSVVLHVLTLHVVLVSVGFSPGNLSVTVSGVYILVCVFLVMDWRVAQG